jgi:hypothetical protein
VSVAIISMRGMNYFQAAHFAGQHLSINDIIAETFSLTGVTARAVANKYNIIVRSRMELPYRARAAAAVNYLLGIKDY